MSNDAAAHEMAATLALVEEQIADIAAVQKKQRAVTASASAADGLVVVRVNAMGQVVGVDIDESFVEEHEFEELGGFVVQAAGAAAVDAGRQVAALIAPIAERRKVFPSLSDIVEGAPDFGEVLSGFGEGAAWLSVKDPEAAGGDGGSDGGFPRVRG